jgi:hypothetical protein
MSHDIIIKPSDIGGESQIHSQCGYGACLISLTQKKVATYLGFLCFIYYGN